MKKLPIHLMAGLGLLLASQHSYSQDILWEKSYGGRHAEYLSDVQPTADYGFILGGSSLSNKSGNKTDAGSGDLDYWIWKMDEHGGAEWQKAIGGSGTDLLCSIRTTHDGGFLLGGTSNSPKGGGKSVAGHGGNDYWVVKLDAKGNQMWQACFGGIGQDDLHSVLPTRDGGYLLAGSSDSTPAAGNHSGGATTTPPAAAGNPSSRGATPSSGHPSKGGEFQKGEFLKGLKKANNQGNMDYWIVKIDADGNEEWQKSYGGDYADHLRSVQQTKDGGYIVGGYSNSPTSGDKRQESYGQSGDFWVLKLDDKGAIEWQQVFGGDGEDELYSVLQTADKGYIVAGSSNSMTRTAKKGSDFWLLRLDTEGALLWEQAYDFGAVDVLTSLVENPDGSLLMGGYSPLTSLAQEGNEGINDYIALKVDAKGEELWRRSLGSEGEDILKKAIMTRDGGYLLAGTSNPEFKGHAYKRNRRKKGLETLSPLDKNKQLAVAQKAQQELDSAVNDAATKVNDAVSESMASAVDGVNNAIGKNNDSAFKLGVDGPAGNLLNPTHAGGGQSGGQGQSMEKQGPKPDAKPSGDKKEQFGGKDFWVVKLKDRQKPEVERIRMEAIPNPVVSYTNVIVGFDFTKGTARVYDVAGHELQKFAVDSRTVPVNLSGYPMGVYIVNVSTDNGEGSVKVIKTE